MRDGGMEDWCLYELAALLCPNGEMNCSVYVETMTTRRIEAGVDWRTLGFHASEGKRGDKMARRKTGLALK